jgi:hypothetical protein
MNLLGLAVALAGIAIIVKMVRGSASGRSRDEDGGVYVPFAESGDSGSGHHDSGGFDDGGNDGGDAAGGGDSGAGGDGDGGDGGGNGD